MSHELDALRHAVEQDGEGLTSDEAAWLFALLDATRANARKFRARLAVLEEAAQAAAAALNDALDGP